jgi:hypothetical protein
MLEFLRSGVERLLDYIADSLVDLDLEFYDDEI